MQMAGWQPTAAGHSPPKSGARTMLRSLALITLYAFSISMLVVAYSVGLGA
jgi:hypothetical protein